MGGCRGKRLAAEKRETRKTYLLHRKNPQPTKTKSEESLITELGGLITSSKNAFAPGKEKKFLTCRGRTKLRKNGKPHAVCKGHLPLQEGEVTAGG